MAGSRRGNASELNGHSRVLWSETQNARDEAYPDRVLHGYVEVRLVGENRRDVYWEGWGGAVVFELIG